MFERRLFAYIDWLLVTAIGVLSVIGLVMIFSATYDPTTAQVGGQFYRQLGALLIGLVALGVCLAIDYRVLPANVDTATAIEPGTVLVWDDCPDNISNLFEQGDKSAVDDAFKHAHHVTRQRFVISRILPTAMEPRGCIGAYDRYEDRHTIYCSVGNIHAVRGLLAGDVFGVPENKFRVICGDIGGAFGSKGVTAPENICLLYTSPSPRD